MTVSGDINDDDATTEGRLVDGEDVRPDENGSTADTKLVPSTATPADGEQANATKSATDPDLETEPSIDPEPEETAKLGTTPEMEAEAEVQADAKGGSSDDEASDESPDEKDSATLDAEAAPEAEIEAERSFDPVVTADLDVAGASAGHGSNRTRRRVLAGVLGVVALVGATWGIVEAFEIKGQQVEGTLLSPDDYLAQVVPVEVDGVDNEHTLRALGWETTPTERVTGRLFARMGVHDPVEPPGGVIASPVLDGYRDELHLDPTAPLIDATWKVVEGTPGVTSDVSIEGTSPLARIVVSPVEVAPDSSASLQRFVEERNRDIDGWEIKLYKDDGEHGASLSPEEVLSHVEFDRESASVRIIDEPGLRTLLDERTRSFVRGAERGRFEFAASEDGVTPVIRAGKLEVLDELAKPLPGEIADLDAAWANLVGAVQSFRRAVAVPMVEPNEPYGGIEPADLAVKLSESRTPNTGGSRMTNIRNVLETTRGIIVEPGGVFGMNQTIGKRTADKGYRVAGAIANGEHVESFGGGVSQAATMFHQAAYMAGLTFPEREGGGIGGGHQTFGHSESFGRYNNYYAEGWGLDGQMDTGRLGFGVEQTVNWPNREAGFINTTPYPILVWTFDTGRQVGVSLWSLERDRFGVYEGTSRWSRGSCIDWTHSRTVYNMDDEILFEDSYNGFYRTQGPTCAFTQPETDEEEQ